MPPQLSKFFIDCTCKQHAHPWQDSCISTAAGLGLHVLQESLRMYSTLYLVTLLMKGRIPSKNDVKKTILSILQSTAFLSWNGFSYAGFICLLRRLLRNFHFLTVSYVPAFLASLMAIFIERPSRRTLLCLYVANVALETLFRMGVWRGYVSVIPWGEVYIFAASISLLLYFFRSKGNEKDAIYKIIRFLVGEYEDNAHMGRQHSVFESSLSSTRKDIKRKEQDLDTSKKADKNDVNIVLRSLRVYNKIIEQLKAQSKHISCPHPYSCAHYVLTGAAKLFGCGLGAQIVINLAFNFRKFLTKPHLIKSTIFNKKTFNLAVFLGGFCGSYRLVSCLLRRVFQQDSIYYAIPAGLVGSIAFMAYPNTTVALYFMWKTLQLLWNHNAENGIVPDVKWFPIFLYCCSTALLFHAAIFEPQNLRTSYWRFLYNISGGRIAVMSRVPLQEFGLDSLGHLQKVLKQTNTTDKHVFSF